MSKRDFGSTDLFAYAYGKDIRINNADLKINIYIKIG